MKNGLAHAESDQDHWARRLDVTSDSLHQKFTRFVELNVGPTLGGQLQIDS